MKPLLLALVPLASFASFGCFGQEGSGKIVTEHRKAEVFERIDVSGAIDVVVTIDDEPSVAVETDENLQKFVVAEVKGKTLHLRQTENIDATKLLVRITTPSLTRFESSGATEAKITGLEGERFELEISGAAEVELEGEVEVFVVEASGAASVSAEDLIAERVEVEGSGASNSSVYAGDALSAELSGAGALVYAGEPDDVKTELSGVASVERR